KLRVRDTVDFITAIELTDARSDCFHDTGEIRAERQRRLRTHLALALANQRIPRRDSRRCDPDQHFSHSRNGTRYVLNHDHIGRTKTMDARSVHLSVDAIVGLQLTTRRGPGTRAIGWRQSRQY